MGANTAIQWCDYTFNHISGCTKVSAECQHCYAEVSLANTMRGVQWGPNGTRVITTDGYWQDPLAWDRKARKAGQRHRVFCASLGDVFEDWDGPILSHRGTTVYTQPGVGFGGIETAAKMAPTTMQDVRQKLFNLIDATPNLDWLLLTKRPENIRGMINLVGLDRGTTRRLAEDCDNDGRYYRHNVWLGTSAGTQETADKAIPELLKCRDLAAKLFVSCEPMLEPVDFTKLYNGGAETYDALRAEVSVEGRLNPIGGRRSRRKFRTSDNDPLDWIIFGGESGPHARECNHQWILDGVKQCQDAGVAAFVKQLGQNSSIQTNDKKGGDMNHWPQELQVRELP